MATDSRVSHASAPVVALCAWLLPGSGYALIGQMGRAIVIGLTIILLFIAGLLIAGVRVVEVPGFDVDTGEKRMTTIVTPRIDRATGKTVVDGGGAEIMDPVRDPVTRLPMKRWVLEVSVLGEIRDKPWSVPQALAGPIAIVAGYCSVEAAHVDPATVKLSEEHGNDPKLIKHYGEVTHARINEIGSLYLSVAGLLNLMAIIDCTWRASHMNEKREEAA